VECLSTVEIYRIGSNSVVSLTEIDSVKIISFIMTIVSISTLIQSFFYIQPNTASDSPSFATSMKINNVFDNASHIYYNEANWQKLNSCWNKQDGTCLNLKLKMMFASFMKRDNITVSKIYDDLNNINTKRNSNLSNINSIISQAKVIVAETYFNAGYPTDHTNHKYFIHPEEIVSKNSSKLQPLDNRAIYLDAISLLKQPKYADNYTLESLNKIHKAVDHISKNGDLFYLNSTGHDELALESFIPIFIKNINYFIIGTLIASLIAFPVIVRHYNHQGTIS
jgi:hypothetical protein